MQEEASCETDACEAQTRSTLLTLAAVVLENSVVVAEEC